MLSSFLSKPIIKRLLATGVGFIIGLIIIACFLGVIWASGHPPHVDISRSQYEEALARWQAQKVEEYEITTYTNAFPPRTRTLHVSEHGNKVERPGPQESPVPAMTDAERQYLESRKDEDMQDLKRDTVEGLFATVDAILKDNEVVKSATWMSSGEFYMAYQVSFDSNLGYPNRIAGRPITQPGVHVYDADWEETVTSLKIIKQSK